jgi:two-component system KDP operon response regulator KdpE
MNNKATILVVEDESGISHFMSTMLQANGYRTLTADRGQEALDMVYSHGPDVVLLDLGLPDMDGLDLLKSLRTWSTLPVVVVSARGNEKEKVAALDLGADDYITKPFGTAELLARIRTAMRHSLNVTRPAGENIFTVGEMKLDFDKRLVTIAGKDVHLTQIEYKIVTLLCKYVGRVLTYEFIIKEVWGPYTARENQILRVNMANIRRKMEANPAEPRYITTEVGVGYRMADE